MQLTRQQMWQQLGEPVDLLVIGGGINGAGIARDAAMRGLSVALVEARDLAYGTSSRSSKLVHGGLRYLEQLEFSLVFESVSERRILMDIAPHLVRPLGFLFPVFGDSRHNLTVINTGLWLYEGLSLFRSPKRHRRFGSEEVLQREPMLRSEDLKGAPLYYDCSTDDARLTLESALDAAEQGATIATWAKAVEFVKDDTGRITGAVVEDTLGDGGRKTIRANTVVNATGPWVDDTRDISDKRSSELLRPTKGIHVVVERQRLPVNNAVVCFHPDDERLLFAIPWGERTYLGTTDTDFDGDPGCVMADADDVDYLITAANDYFPDCNLGPDDIIATWAGLRPLIAPDGAGDDDEEVSESDVSREHQIIIDEDGLITIAGGKLTTYRRMSAEVVDTAVKLLRLADKLPDKLEKPETDRRSLPGARGWPEGDDTTVFRDLSDRTVEASDGHLDDGTAGFLVYNYGVRAPELARLVADNPRLGEPICEGRPEIMAQIDWGVTMELAATVTDVLIQRTQLYYRDTDQGLGAVEKVADHMAKLLDWDQETISHQIERYRRDVELSRRWKQQWNDDNR